MRGLGRSTRTSKKRGAANANPGLSDSKQGEKIGLNKTYFGRRNCQQTKGINKCDVVYITMTTLARGKMAANKTFFRTTA